MGVSDAEMLWGKAREPQKLGKASPSEAEIFLPLSEPGIGAHPGDSSQGACEELPSARWTPSASCWGPQEMKPAGGQLASGCLAFSPGPPSPALPRELHISPASAAGSVPLAAPLLALRPRGEEARRVSPSVHRGRKPRVRGRAEGMGMSGESH